MDPLSITAGIIAVLGASGNVICYLNDLKNASEDRHRILSEVLALQPVLYNLRDKAMQAQQDEAWMIKLRSMSQPDGPIHQLEAILKRLEELLNPSGRRRKLSKALVWPLRREEVKDHLHALERVKTLFILAQQSDHVELTKAVQGSVASIHKKVEEIGDNLIQRRIDISHEKIRQWLAPPDPSVNYNKCLKERFPGTGTWFTEGPVFTGWKKSSKAEIHSSRSPCRMLWLYGSPGCGKSVLSCTVIENLFDRGSFKNDTAMLYFYFDFNDTAKQSYEKMIRSLIVQLSSRSPSTPSELKNLYSHCLNGEEQPAFQSLMGTLHDMMKYFAKLYIVLDALDECLDREDLLECIEHFAEWDDIDLHMLVTSRRERDIERSLESIINPEGIIRIQSTLVDHDIRAYVRGRLQQDRGLKKWQKQSKVQQEIEDTLMAKADGM